MPTKVIVQSGELEFVHPVEMPVMRIGRSEDCDIQIDGADVAGHLLTIEYRDGGYLVHNRSNTDIFVDRQSVAAGSSHSLQAGQVLSIGDDIQIALEVDGDPSPAPAVTDERYTPIQYPSDDDFGVGDGDSEFGQHDSEDDLHDEESDPSQREGAALDPKSILNIVVIVFCIAAIATIFLFRDTPVPHNVGSLEALFRLADFENEWEQDVVRGVQRAEGLRLRGQRESARRAFLQLQDELHNVASSSEDSVSEFTSNARAFVRDRILELNDE